MRSRFILLLAILFCGHSAFAAESPAAAHFKTDIQPILSEYCYDCHADGANKGNVAFDEFKSDESIVTNRTLWLNALKNLRAGLMPPQKKPHPSPEQLDKIVNWIKYDAFNLDPNNPDPGKVTLRRLNRVEYRNSIRDLTGVDYDTNEEFPADDTGYGFDNIGDVLTLSPMLFEKYLDAAKAIVSKTVPTVSRVLVEKVITGSSFRDGYRDNRGSLRLSYYEKASVSKKFHAEHDGKYQLVVDLAANESFVDDKFDYNKCRLIFKADGAELMQREFTREGGKPFHFEFNRDWQKGDHELAFEVVPLTPDEKQVRALSLRLDSVTVRGPMEEKYQIQPKNYARWFPKEPPKKAAERRAYARELLAGFASKAFRHPVDDATLDRLVKLAEDVYKERGKTFEAGISQAMIAVLASPQFLFREENLDPQHAPGTQPFVDDYALASRLSYFLWSSMPDDELFQLAAKKQLRANLPAQVKRMVADERFDAFIKNFAGQWLQARDIETVNIDERSVLEREENPDPEHKRLVARFRELREIPREERTPAQQKEVQDLREKLGPFRAPRVEMSYELRRSMQREVEFYLGHVVHDDRSVLELIDSDYTYLNERLARHYGLTNLDISGSEMRLVKLPADSPRGGVLTMANVLAVTSNPTRTSPVKRGLFILDNVLGTPAPPPPPNIPPLEDSDKQVGGHNLALREVLAIHRDKPLCASCHDRLDPLGLAFENFNAMGMWRDKERDQGIEPTGKLITGESFNNVRELKHILATKHSEDFYRTLTGKMLTYALGRGLEYYDVETVDQIVDGLEKNDGKFSALLNGIIESAPFQKRRESATVPVVRNSGPVQRADRAVKDFK